MSGISGALAAHLATGSTTVARAFAVTRADGQVFGFTDHDRDLSFDGIAFRADSGLTAKAFSQATGLAVDNSEAFGALTSSALTEADILAGRFDRAEVKVWLVNWVTVSERALIFRGTVGDITRSGGAFTAELRGLAEALNVPKGRVYQARCDAALGDSRCAFDPGTPGYFSERPAETVEAGQRFAFADFAGFEDRWFEKGRLVVLGGPAQGLSGVIKNDRLAGATGRVVELWQAIRADILPGDRIRLEAGCDRAADTCRLKFNNFLNFRGFPDIPGEDWLMVTPTRAGVNDGGSRRS